MLTVVLPVKNEPNLIPFLLRLHEVLESIPEPYEVLVVRGDREKLNNPLPPLPNQTELKCYADSLERAILLGFSCAKGDKICVCDADGSHPIDLIPTMNILLASCDIVVGSRFLSESKFHQTFFRKFVSKVFVKYAQFFGSNLTDPMSGFFLFRKKILEKVKFLPYTWKTCLEIELKSGGRVEEIPITFNNRADGISKADLGVATKIFKDLLFEKL